MVQTSGTVKTFCIPRDPRAGVVYCAAYNRPFECLRKFIGTNDK